MRLIDWRPKPQSLVRISRSGSICFSARRMRSATSSGRSTCSVRWLMTPSAIFLFLEIIVPKCSRSMPLLNAPSTVITSTSSWSK